LVHLQWPIARGKRKSSTLTEADTSGQLRAEAGLTKIRGTEDLASRIGFTDDFFAAMINHTIRQLDLLIRKTNKSPQDLEEIQLLNGYLANWEAYRAVKKSGMAWSTSGEDHDMSQRYRAFETYFTRNWQDPWEVKKIVRMAMYMLDISFKQPHVDPAPTIIVQSMPKGSSINLGDWGGEAASAEEKVQ
jgi:hypothetical protein